MANKYKPNLIVDFDGTLTQYKNGWQGIDVINEEPVEGAMRFLIEAVDYFTVNIFSSRSSEEKGINAMQNYIRQHLADILGTANVDIIYDKICWPTTKPAGFVSIDDRSLQFNGDWSKFNPKELLNFKPWNKI